MNERIAERFTIIKHIATGGYGSVFLGRDETTNSEVVIKRDRYFNGPIRREAVVYEKLNEITNVKFPKMFYHGLDSLNNGVLALEKLGSSLANVLLSEEISGSLSAIAMIGIQVISKLEALHEKGYVHCDIHPANLLSGIEDESEIYLIDFGSARKYLDEDGNQITGRRTSAIPASMLFSSLGRHNGDSPERMWDLESLAYIFKMLRFGELPWSYSRSLTELIHLKRSIGTHLFDRMPREFGEFFTYCRSSTFGEKPNYIYLKYLMQEVIRNDGNS